MVEQIIRVNLDEKTILTERVPEDYELIGGRGLIAKILTKETPPLCDPLGGENKLVICPGPLAGTMAPSFGRTSVGAKSPLTMGIKESNAGGTAGQKLGKLGIKAIIIEGKLKEETPYILKIDPENSRLTSTPELKGKGNYETTENLAHKFGNKVSIISIGPCGEMKLKSASIAFTDLEGRPCRQAARGGLGAVMGSKGLKAIVIDDHELPITKPKNPGAFRNAIKSLLNILQGERGVPSYRSIYGTSGALNIINALGCLPTRNFREGSFDGAEKISGETLKELNQIRGGKMHACMPGCIIKCSNVFYDKDRKYLTAALEYETISLMGSNLGIDDLDTIAQMDKICDDLGLDTIEIGNALGLFMEAGTLRFGDKKETIELLKEIGKGTDRGKVLGNGAVTTGNFFNIKRIAHARGQGLPAHDPRVSKPAGVTYCTSPMGGDHTAGVDYSGDPMDKETAIEKSRQVQIIVALVDTLGYCLLAMPLDKKTLIELFVNILNAHFGKDLSSKDLLQIGWQVISDELAFNEAAGLPSNQFYLADFFSTEPLPPRGSVFDVDREKIKRIWNDCG